MRAIRKFSRNVTIKGGVVMRSLTGNVRRATQDMDLDFIRYSLSESSIREFIEKLNCLDGITITIAGDIEELSQQEYRGKRVYVTLADDTGHSFFSKIDLGVHKQIQIEQDEYCFDVCLDDVGASLLINSKEQIFTEYKDIFDLCYLADYVEQTRLYQCMDTYIFRDPGMREIDMSDVINRVNRTFSNRLYRRNIERAGSANWIGIEIPAVFEKIKAFLNSL